MSNIVHLIHDPAVRTALNEGSARMREMQANTDRAFASHARSLGMINDVLASIHSEAISNMKARLEQSA